MKQYDLTLFYLAMAVVVIAVIGGAVFGIARVSWAPFLCLALLLAHYMKNGL